MSDAGLNARPFSIEQRIYYQHTDAGGVVYHANYLALMEAARTEFLHHCGFDVAALAQQDGVMFVVHHAELSFLRPARLQDRVTITARPAHVARARLRFSQEIYRADACLVTASIDLACVDAREWRPVAVPDDVREAMLARTRVESKPS